MREVASVLQTRDSAARGRWRRQWAPPSGNIRPIEEQVNYPLALVAHCRVCLPVLALTTRKRPGGPWQRTTTRALHAGAPLCGEAPYSG